MNSTGSEPRSVTTDAPVSLGRLGLKLASASTANGVLALSARRDWEQALPALSTSAVLTASASAIAGDAPGLRRHERADLALPFHARLPAEDQERVVDVLARALSK